MFLDFFSFFFFNVLPVCLYLFHFTKGGQEFEDLDAQIKANIVAASCQIIKTDVSFGTGVLCRFLDPLPAEATEATEVQADPHPKSASHLCILTANTLIPTAFDALHARFQFHRKPSEVCERQTLVICTHIFLCRLFARY